MENKNNNVLMYIVVFVLGALLSFGCSYLLNQKDNKPAQPIVNDKEENKAEVQKEDNKMHVYSYLNDYEGYDLYAFLNNQGSEMTVFDYKGDLYLSEDEDSFTCLGDLFDGKAEFKNDLYQCGSEDEYATLRKLNVKTSEVNSVKLINSCGTDGLPMMLFVMKDGTVKYLEYMDKSKEENNNYFKEYNTKDIIDFTCETNQGTEKRESIYTLLLEDGKTQEVRK